jgi:hypothetical protein
VPFNEQRKAGTAHPMDVAGIVVCGKRLWRFRPRSMWSSYAATIGVRADRCLNWSISILRAVGLHCLTSDMTHCGSDGNISRASGKYSRSRGPSLCMVKSQPGLQCTCHESWLTDSVPAVSHWVELFMA